MLPQAKPAADADSRRRERAAPGGSGGGRSRSHWIVREQATVAACPPQVLPVGVIRRIPCFASLLVRGTSGSGRYTRTEWRCFQQEARERGGRVACVVGHVRSSFASTHSHTPRTRRRRTSRLVGCQLHSSGFFDSASTETNRDLHIGELPSWAPTIATTRRTESVLYQASTSRSGVQLQPADCGLMKWPSDGRT